MPLDELQNLLQSIEPSAHLVEPIVLRRVVRLDRRLQGWRFLIPHDFSYTIDRDRLLAFVDLSELSVPPGSDLPRRLILLAQPDEDEIETEAQRRTLQERYCRSLFHACVHLELDRQIIRNGWGDDWVEERKNEIGQIEFAEIHEVLLKSNLLFYPPSEIEIFVEFAALWLELKYFASEDRAIYFPAIRNWQAIDDILLRYVDHPGLIERVLQGLGSRTELVAPHDEVASQSKASKTSHADRIPITVSRLRMAKAAHAASLGNSVKAILSYLSVARRAFDDIRIEAELAAEEELTRLSERLQNVFVLNDDETAKWRELLKALSVPAGDGYWSTEARLLYDLQKVCTEQERGVYRLDLVDWIRTFGRRPMRRPLPLMQDALTLRHLRTVQRRIPLVRLSRDEQVRLGRLVEAVLPRIESRFRDRLRVLVTDVFDEVGFVPKNLLEEISRKKLTEELLDRIVERSYITMGDLRDAISKNDLKLTDVTRISEVVFGDIILRADRKFDMVLDGIYRRGAIYLRWPQALSSLVFGTNIGRRMTRHLFIPFGGAYLTIEFLRHLAAMISGDHDHADLTSHTHDPVVDAAGGGAAAHLIQDEVVSKGIDYPLYAGVLLLGTWISLLIERPDFREWNLNVLSKTWKTLRHLVVEFPSQVLHSESVQRMLGSRTFAVVRSYILEPGLIVFILSALVWAGGNPWSWHLMLDVYLVTALFLNSPVGRFVSERTVDLMVRAWQEFKMHIFAALIQWIVDLFDWMLMILERMVYTVDEWLRFRSGDAAAMRAVKLAGGVVWFFVSYVVVFIFTLLVEPQINPVKHFPVVTVSHKIIIGAYPEFVRQLTPFMGLGQARSVALTTMWLIPGVFGFLFWELKENWRLYSANRSRLIRPESIGHHGETMLRLLRPGIHSGTFPKAFGSLRRILRKGRPSDESRMQRKQAGIHHAEEAVRHFVERELIELLESVHFLPESSLSVGFVHGATNRIDLELIRDDQLDSPARITWEYDHGVLTGRIEPAGWINDLTEADRDVFIEAMEHLFQLAGVQQVQGDLPISVSPPLVWEEAVARWNRIGKERYEPCQVITVDT